MSSERRFGVGRSPITVKLSQKLFSGDSPQLESLDRCALADRSPRQPIIPTGGSRPELPFRVDQAIGSA